MGGDYPDSGEWKLPESFIPIDILDLDSGRCGLYQLGQEYLGTPYVDEGYFQEQVSIYKLVHIDVVWYCFVRRWSNSEGERGVKVSFLPDICPLEFLASELPTNLDTLVGRVFRASGFEYLYLEGLDSCIDGFPYYFGSDLFEVKHYVLVYPIGLKSYTPLFDTSCADVEKVELIGLPGPGVSGPHGGGGRVTFLVFDGRLIEQ